MIPQSDQEGKIAAVVVGFNNLAYLEGCLESLYEQTRAVDRIVYVDNASEDDSVGFIRSRFPKVAVRVNATNLGFATDIGKYLV